ncbi:MAG: master DNA invertase Mpi family serine-type recombinase [Bacteroidales bacterium]|nr:master DNA invertase Mpi family serine-type recombinase [Bacteroidales bacterium]
MIFCYIRVSTDRQTVENQRYEIEQFCLREGLSADRWIEETISGTRDYGKRKLGKYLKKVRRGDLIICSELSRLGRNLFMVMEILSICMERGCRVWTVKEGYRLGDDIQSKVLAFAFGLSAEIERNLISQRTREALARRRAEGIRLGRPQGARNNRYRLDAKSEQIKKMLGAGKSKAETARKLGVTTKTLNNWIARNELIYGTLKHCEDRKKFVSENNFSQIIYAPRPTLVRRVFLMSVLTP